MASPPTWKIGSVLSTRDSASMPSTWLAARAFARWLSSARRAALGTPVVPEVKRMVAGSPAGSTSAIDASCAARSESVSRVFCRTISAPLPSAPSTRPKACGEFSSASTMRRDCAGSSRKS